jgi:hypothetical protein
MSFGSGGKIAEKEFLFLFRGKEMSGSYPGFEADEKTVAR